MKRLYAFLFAATLLALAGCGPSSFNNPNASGRYASSAEQCAPYARKLSGLALYGDAASWWQQAAGRYRRGHRPEPGAALVLKRTSRMRSGHVAVVKQLLGPRAISVAHTNWGNTRSSRRIVYDAMRAEDVSSANDWTSVRFWNQEKGVMGFPYAAYGFIYP